MTTTPAALPKPRRAICARASGTAYGNPVPRVIQDYTDIHPIGSTRSPIAHRRGQSHGAIAWSYRKHLRTQ